jgi:quinol monooxygenase YgiN
LDPTSQIINVNEYDLVGSVEAFTMAIGALARRTETEGHPGVLRYQFYVNGSEGTAGATIVYADAAAWVAHHQMAYQWEEMAALQATVSLQRLTVLGPIDDAIREWVANRDFTINHYDMLAAGFVRSGA